MHRRLLTLLLGLLLLLLPACERLAVPEPQGPLTGERLVEALRDGGLVLYLRHTETTKGGVDDVSTLGDCAQQRELSDFGRQDARELGQAFEALDIPVGRVLASPFCRTVETAELAFGEATPEEDLLALDSLPPADREDGVERVRALLAQKPPDETNTVLVGHISNLQPATGASPEEGGTVVFRPDGDGGFLVVGEVAPQGWQRLAERY